MQKPDDREILSMAETMRASEEPMDDLLSALVPDSMNRVAILTHNLAREVARAAVAASDGPAARATMVQELLVDHVWEMYREMTEAPQP